MICQFNQVIVTPHIIINYSPGRSFDCIIFFFLVYMGWVLYELNLVLNWLSRDSQHQRNKGHIKNVTKTNGLFSSIA